MQLDELLGLCLTEARLCLHGQLIKVKTIGLSRQPEVGEEDIFRVVRAKQTVDGFELTVVLPPVLRTGC